MKIVSFLPAATKMIYDMGLEDQLYAVTFECPKEAADLPKVVRYVLEGNTYTSEEIDQIFSASKAQGKSMYWVDEEIMESIVVILKEIKDTPVPPEELNKVKEYTLGMMRLGLESSDSIAGFYGSQILLKGEYKTPEQLTKEYMKVTAEDIQRVAKKILTAKNANLAVVGPFEEGVVNTELLKKL